MVGARRDKPRNECGDEMVNDGSKYRSAVVIVVVVMR